MNTKFFTLAVLGTLGLMAAAPRAQAADNGFYLGAGITKTEFDSDDIDTVELDDSSFKVIAGIRPLDWLAFEVNYVDLGSDSEELDPGFSPGVVSKIEANAVTGSVLLLKEFQIVDVYARAGLAHWKVDGSSSITPSRSETGDEFTYGVGVGVHFGSVGVRAEYEKFEISDIDTDVNTLSLSFTYTFL
jgi:opacity protein-like surface antigen